MSYVWKWDLGVSGPASVRGALCSLTGWCAGLNAPGMERNIANIHVLA